MCEQIKAQWCRLAARITATLVIIVSVLGSTVKKHLHWNTAALFFILSIIAMRLMHRIEVSYSHAHKTDEWEHIKRHNDKSFFATYHISRLFTLIGNEERRKINLPDIESGLDI